jgi:MgsA AAA+ ATPase C terminal
MSDRIFIALAESKSYRFLGHQSLETSCATYLAKPPSGSPARSIPLWLLRPNRSADPWLINSLLQKSIRRGEKEIAQRPAMTLSKHRGAAIWRRLIVIAFEDIGIGSVGAVTMTVAASDDSAWRRAHGGDIRLAVAVAGILAQAPKDRSADYLGGAKDHPLLAGFAQEMASAPPATRLSRIGSRRSTCRIGR